MIQRRKALLKENQQNRHQQHEHQSLQKRLKNLVQAMRKFEKECEKRHLIV
jgi:uncharacterized protein (DUF3084 family)